LIRCVLTMTCIRGGSSKSNLQNAPGSGPVAGPQRNPLPHLFSEIINILTDSKGFAALRAAELCRPSADIKLQLSITVSANRFLLFQLSRSPGFYISITPSLHQLYYQNPYSFHLSSTSFLISGVITTSSGHSRVKPSVFHFFVASMPILPP